MTSITLNKAKLFLMTALAATMLVIASASSSIVYAQSQVDYGSFGGWSEQVDKATTAPPASTANQHGPSTAGGSCNQPGNRNSCPLFD